MLKNLKKQQQGFTIIEVMIVLVIAAVILLIVFLAVPALQRNNRNTQRKNDASRILAGAQEWRANNSNQVPPTCVTVFGCASGSPNDVIRVAVLSNAGKLGIYNTGAVSITPASGTTDLNTVTGGLWDFQKQFDTPAIYTNARCDNANSVTTGSELVVVYTLEGANGSKSLSCV